MGDMGNDAKSGLNSVQTTFIFSRFVVGQLE